MNGTPGAVAPASTPSGVEIRARYQIPGIENPRCGSPASNGAPVELCAPSTAHSLLAIPGHVNRSGNAGANPASRSAAPSSRASGPTPSCPGHNARTRSGGNRAINPRRTSSCRQLPDKYSPIVLPQSRQSTAVQASGAPNMMNSGAENRPRSPIHAFTPRAYASSIPRVAGSNPARSASARRRSPNIRIVRSSRSVAPPATSDNRPDAFRRIRSIWNIRSRACMNPSAAAPSSALPASIRGTPSPSSVTCTGPESPGTTAPARSPGNDHHTAPPNPASITSSTRPSPASPRRTTRINGAKDPSTPASGPQSRS